VSETSSSGDASIFDAEDYEDGEVDRDAERAETEEAAGQAEVMHGPPDEREQELEHERGEVDTPEVLPEETPGELEPASVSAAADDKHETPAHEHQEPESSEVERLDEEGRDLDQDLERPSVPPSPAEPVSADGRRDQEAADEHSGNQHGGSEEKRSVTVNTSRTVVINVGENVEVGGEGSRRGWWQRLLS
jgi:hypothetical protein